MRRFLIIASIMMLGGAALAHTSQERLDAYGKAFSILVYRLNGHRAVITNIDSKWVGVQEMTLGEACTARPLKERIDITGDGTFGMSDWILIYTCSDGHCEERPDFEEVQ